jgi:hypothetical protein
VEEEDLTTVGFGIILLIVGLIITGTGIIWLIARRRGGERTEKISSSGVRMEMINNNKDEKKIPLHTKSGTDL